MRTIIAIVATLALAALCVSLYALTKSPRIAVVRSGIVLEKYEGMKESRELYQKKLSAYSAELDSMQRDVMTATREEHSLKEESLMNATENFRKMAGEENQRLTAASVNQFNTFVQDFAKEKGYDVVLGVTLSGNILYAGEAEDITEEVLEELNKKYKGR